MKSLGENVWYAKAFFNLSSKFTLIPKEKDLYGESVDENRGFFFS
jgi:hypothetical protein